MQSVLFVCSRNTFRSAFAEVVFKYIVQNSNVEMLVASAGVQVFEPEESAVSRLCEIAQQRGYDLSQHKSRSINSYKSEDFTHVLYFDESQREQIHCWANASDIEIAPLISYADEIQRDTFALPQADSELTYRIMLDYIEVACLNFWHYINESNNKR